MRGPSQIVAPLITEVGDYRGETVIRVRATELGTTYTPTAARKVVAAWCEFLAAGPSPIVDLTFVTRTPKRLFAALSGQSQLGALRIKWGDYDDLAALSGMTGLEQLYLGGAARVPTLTPLRSLARLRELCVESLRHVHDLGPLGDLVELVDLEIGGDWISPRTVHVDSLAFLRRLPRLQRLVLHSMIVDDLDYSPLLSHRESLTEVRVARARGMRPTHDDLCREIPALQPIRR